MLSAFCSLDVIQEMFAPVIIPSSAPQPGVEADRKSSVVYVAI